MSHRDACCDATRLLCSWHCRLLALILCCLQSRRAPPFSHLCVHRVSRSALACAWCLSVMFELMARMRTMSSLYVPAVTLVVYNFCVVLGIGVTDTEFMRNGFCVQMWASSCLNSYVNCRVRVSLTGVSRLFTAEAVNVTATVPTSNKLSFEIIQ